MSINETPQSLILNSPFAKPTRFWDFDSETQKLFPENGRREAGYIVYETGKRKRPGAGARRVAPLDLVNKIRPRVDEWRDGGFPGVSGVTRALLAHWRKRGRNEKRFFFCQLEAIETLIWIVEVDGARKSKIEIPADGGAFSRLCSKLATGAGKTVVMAMLVAWQTLNKIAAPDDDRFARDFLVVAPGLTVKDRLQVLRPSAVGNYYDEFEIAPRSMRDRLNSARLRIVNWQALAWESEKKIRSRRRVDKRGAKSLEAYARESLGDLAAARGFVVINDEAHHAWRKPADAKIEASAEEKKAATVWIGALDRLHRARGVSRCFDFSATPFIPSGAGDIEKLVYPWIVSDFGLNDAIESGLVKTPRIVVDDDALPDPKTYRSRLWHIFADDEVKADLSRGASAAGAPPPDLVRNAYELLGADWQKYRAEWKKHDHPVPPVMISVVNRVETANRIMRAIENRSLLTDACAPEQTLQIDSAALKKAESGDDEAQAAAPLREKVNTVGQAQGAGAKIEHVVSVSMLSEGWDAKTVTHIMGLRAFNSQLLCEQVVGRGLRRVGYDADENDMFDPEYVNVFGVPFDIIDRRGATGEKPPPPPPPKIRIEAVAAKARFALQWPRVLRIDQVMASCLRIDWERVGDLPIRYSEAVVAAELAPFVAGKTAFADRAKIDLQKFEAKYRPQTFLFKAAIDILQNRPAQWSGDILPLAAQLVKLSEEFVAKKVSFQPPLTAPEDERLRAILIALQSTRIFNAFFQAISVDNRERLLPVFDSQKPVRATGDMPTWFTGRPTREAQKSHINRCVADSAWEPYVAARLDKMPQVAAWAKNDRLGFEIEYIARGVARKYWPDFLLRLADGAMMILEIKGKVRPDDEEKWSEARRWRDAVNQDGRFGIWRFEVAQRPDDAESVVRAACRSRAA